LKLTFPCTSAARQICTANHSLASQPRHTKSAIHHRTLKMLSRRGQRQIKTNFDRMYMDPGMWWVLVSRMHKESSLAIPTQPIQFTMMIGKELTTHTLCKQQSAILYKRAATERFVPADTSASTFFWSRRVWEQFLCWSAFGISRVPRWCFYCHCICV
jgi:hypothetical protein